MLELAPSRRSSRASARRPLSTPWRRSRSASRPHRPRRGDAAGPGRLRTEVLARDRASVATAADPDSIVLDATDGWAALDACRPRPRTTPSARLSAVHARARLLTGRRRTRAGRRSSHRRTRSTCSCRRCGAPTFGAHHRVAATDVATERVVTGLLRKRVFLRTDRGQAALRRGDRRRRRERPVARLQPRGHAGHHEGGRVRARVHRRPEARDATPRSSARTTTPRRPCRSTSAASRSGAPSARSWTSTSCSATRASWTSCTAYDALEVERDKSLLNRAYGVTTDILTTDEVAKMCPLVDVDGGGELPVIGASLPPARLDRAPRLGGVGVRLGRAAPGRGHPRGRRRHRPRRDATVSCTGVQTDAGPVTRRLRRERRGRLHEHPRRHGRAQAPHQHASAAGVRHGAVRARAGRARVESMDLYIYVSQTARGELLAGAEILPYNTYSTRSTFDFLAEAVEALHHDPAVHGEGARDAPVDRPLRHDARLLARCWASPTCATSS